MYREVCRVAQVGQSEVLLWAPLSLYSEPQLPSAPQMSVIRDRTQWMIWADTCLIERVEKNPHKPQNYSLFMFREGTASKTTHSDHSTGSLTGRCRTTFTSLMTAH